MAYTALNTGINQEKGITYSGTTDTSADWGSVPADSYFYDFETDLPYYKNASDTVISIFSSGGGGGNTIYTADDTVGTGRIATLTDTLRFKDGTVEIQGVDTLNTSSALQIYDGDSTPNKLWDFRNDGNVNLEQPTKFISIQQEIACFQSSGLNPYITINATSSTNRSSFLFQRQSVNKWLFGNDGLSNDSFRIRNLSAGNNPIILGNGNNTIDITYDLNMNNNRITNAVINPSVQEATNSATFTINADEETDGVLTAMSADTTISAPTGTPVQCQDLVFRFKDDGTARLLNWNVIFRAIGVTLPTTTVAGKLTYVGCKYNSTDTKWDVVAVQQEA